MPSKTCFHQVIVSFYQDSNGFSLVVQNFPATQCCKMFNRILQGFSYRTSLNQIPLYSEACTRFCTSSQQCCVSGFAREKTHRRRNAAMPHGIRATNTVTPTQPTNRRRLFLSLFLSLSLSLQFAFLLRPVLQTVVFLTVSFIRE